MLKRPTLPSRPLKPLYIQYLRYKCRNKFIFSHLVSQNHHRTLRESYVNQNSAKGGKKELRAGESNPELVGSRDVP
jgi:hypothetical protein